jgi:hypothetical protein
MAKTQDVPSRDAKRRWTASGRSSWRCVACCSAEVKEIARTALRRRGRRVAHCLAGCLRSELLVRRWMVWGLSQSGQSGLSNSSSFPEPPLSCVEIPCVHYWRSAPRVAVEYPCCT